LPSLESLHQQFKDDPFVILAIDIKESKDAVLKSVRRNGLSYTNLLDTDGQVSAQYGVSSTPVKFLVDRQGNMVTAAMGYRDWSKDDFKSLIQSLINAKQQ
jgi:thioredoxin-related protein